MDKSKIVIVEDELLIALEIEERLKRLGYEVCGKAINTIEAIEAVKRYNPDIILLDIKIEGKLDGIETSRKINEIKKVPIIYLTSHTDSNTLNRAKETLPYGFLTKPINEKDLRVTLEMVLHRIKIERELVWAQKQVEISENRYRLIAENSTDLIYVYNIVPEPHYEYISPSCELLTGYKPEECYSDPFIYHKKFVEPESVEKFTKYLMTVPHLLEPIVEKWRKKDGSLIWVEQAINRKYDDKGNIISFQSTARDITARVNSELKIRENEALLKEAQVIGEFGYWELDLVEKKTKWSENNYRIFGYYPFEIEPNLELFRSRVHPEDLSIVDKMHNIMMKEKRTVEYDFRIIDENGSTKWLQNKIKPIVKKDKIIKLFGTNQDITERKLKETEISNKTRFIEILVRAIPIPVFIKDIQGKYVSCNNAFSDFFGLGEADIIGKTFGEIVTKGKADETKKNETILLESLKKQKYEIDLIDKNGSNRNVIVFKDLLIDRNAKPINIIGAFYDVTELKNVQNKLEESEQKYRTVADWAYDWEYWIGPDGDIKYLSPSVERITGYLVNDFYSDPDLIKKIIHKDDINNFISMLKNINGVQESEFRIVTKSGSTKWIQNITRQIYEAGKYLWLRVENRDITENKRALSQIYKLSTAVKQSPFSIMITDANGKIEFANESCSKITGYEFEEIIGCTPGIFKSGKTKKATYKEIWDTILAGKVWEGDLLNKRKNSETYWEHLIISPVFNEKSEIINFVAIKEDITERKRIEKELNEYRTRLEGIVEERTIELKMSEEKYRVLAENSEDVIMRFNDNLEHIYVNQSIEKLTGIPAEKFIGKTHRELDFAKDLVNFWETNLENVFRTKKTERVEFQLPNGKWVDCLLVPETEESGEVKSVVGDSRDITNIKEYEDKIEKALSREKELNELKTKFISTASHEFRTPLATILSSTQMIRRFYGSWGEKQIFEQINFIEEGIKNITELMDEVLLISKTENGNFKKALENIELKNLLKETIKGYKGLLKQGQSISLKNILSETEVLADKKMLNQIMGNLISNAIKYSGEGKEIRVEANYKKNRLYLKVIDNGIGIRQNELTKIFEPFYRSSYVEGIEGTGLGLDIVRRFLDILDGKIEVTSKLNHGSTFSVEIPLKRINNSK